MKNQFLKALPYLLVLSLIIACNDSDEVDENKDTSTKTGTDSDTTTDTNTVKIKDTDTASDSDLKIKIPTCEELAPCSEFTCPESDDVSYGCKTISSCGLGSASWKCTTMKIACQIECGKDDCMFLDTTPSVTSCEDY